MLLDTKLKKLLNDKQLKLVLELEKASRDDFFTSWSFSDEEVIISAFNANEYIPRDLEEKVWHPTFDLASLTKPLFGQSSLFSLYKKDIEIIFFTKIHKLLEKLETESSTKLASLIKNSFLKETLLIHLLNHESSLIPWKWVEKSFYNESFQHILKESISIENLQNKVSEKLIRQIIESKIQERDVVYSDLGYILLGLIIQEILKSRNQTWTSHLSDLNANLSSNYSHASLNPELSHHAVPYYPYKIVERKKNLRMKKEFGPVHDTNANIFASQKNPTCHMTSCHAGLFGSILDIEKSLSYYKKIIPSIKDKDLYENKRFFIGLDTKRVSQEKLLGHLGYTGTSFWFSQEREYQIILLTNRTSHLKKSSLNIPRYYIITQKKSPHDHNFIRVSKCHSDWADSQSIYKELKIINEKYETLWDDSYIQKPKNINRLRNMLQETPE